MASLGHNELKIHMCIIFHPFATLSGRQVVEIPSNHLHRTRLSCMVLYHDYWGLGNARSQVSSHGISLSVYSDFSTRGIFLCFWLSMYTQASCLHIYIIVVIAAIVTLYRYRAINNKPKLCAWVCVCFSQPDKSTKNRSCVTRKTLRSHFTEGQKS